MSIVFNNQVVADEAGARWRVVRYSVDDDFVALVKCLGQSVQVMAFHQLLGALRDGTFRVVLSVRRDAEPLRPRFADYRRQAAGFVPKPSRRVQMAASEMGERARVDTLVTRCLHSFLTQRYADNLAAAGR